MPTNPESSEVPATEDFDAETQPGTAKQSAVHPAFTSDSEALDYAYGMICNENLPKMYVKSELDGKEVYALCATMDMDEGESYLIPLCILMDSDLHTRLKMPDGIDAITTTGEENHEGAG